MWKELKYMNPTFSVYLSYKSTRIVKRDGELMKCPYCGSENLKTLETRDSPDNTVRRRKECADCGKRFTTYEYIETVELMVKKKDGRLERFDLNKIIRGLQKACEKRPVSTEQIHELAERVRQDLMLHGKEEISSQEIGDLVMKYLKILDRVAYVRFASVYKRFEEPEDFRRVLQEVKK
jgi:transcriptional repressor NrdR